MIYLWLNVGVIPFWLMLIFFPQTKICKIFVSSVFPLSILSCVYIYLILEIFKSGFNFIDTFNLYLGLDDLIVLFAEKNFAILIWTHFLAINFFCGSWITKDSQKYFITKTLTFFPLVLTYFIGPFGIFLYWIIRIFFSKKIALYD